MTRVAERVGGHGLEKLLFCHAVEDAVAKIGLTGLHQMHRALGEVQRHRPVVGNGVDDILHAGVQRCLRRPDVRADNGQLLGDVPEHRRHQLGVLLVGGVVGELTKALIVERLPDQLVEQPALLRQARAERIEVVLRTDDLGAGGVLKGVEIHPIGLVAQRVRCRRHRNRDAVVTEAHADVADDDALFEIKIRLALSLGNADVAHAEHFAERGVFGQLDGIVRLAVVAEFFDIFLFARDRLAIGTRTDFVAENHL